MEIFTIAEHRRGELNPVSFELLNLTNLIKGDGKSNAIVLGNNARVFAEQLAKYADKVLAIEDEALENYSPELYSDVILQVLKGDKPTLVLIGNTTSGIELAACLAVKLNSPVQSDVVNVEISDGISISKYICQGKVMVDMKLRNSEFYVLLVRQGVFKNGPEIRGNFEVISIKPSTAPRRKFIKFIEPESGEVDISKEDILITVGRGLKDSSNMVIIEELAKLLGGVVAGTRPTIDYGWLPKDRQVGTSGKTVTPKLYLGVGISGASQHVMGMKDSELIIAINKDPTAPIFEVAEYGIIGDIFDIVPKVIDKLR
jgi:electron transfer flavoprotein alpha subunit